MSDVQQKSVEIVVKNQFGVHARPAALFVKTASKYQSEVTVEKESIKVSGKSIMGLMTMEISCGKKIRITAEGADCEQAISELEGLINHKFYEE